MTDHVPSYGQYQAHRRRGEKPCPACVEKNRIYQADYRARSEKARRRDQRTNLAQHRAKQRLADKYRAEYQEFLDEERRRLG
jgi:hypothetical protein